MKITITAAAAASLLAAAAAQAQLQTYDGFDYPAGQALTDQAGGTGWDSTWGQFLGGADNLVVNAAGLGDPSGTLATTGGSVSAVAAEFSGRYPLLPGYGAPGSSTYYSVLIRPDSAPDVDDYYGLQLFSNNGGSDLFVGKGGTGLTYGLETSGGGGLNAASGVAAVAGTSVLLVVRVDFNASADPAADETFRLYVNPLPGGTEPATADAALSFNLGNQNGLAFNSGNGAAVSFDEVRVGTTYASVVPSSVVPEPAGLAVAAGAGLLLARRRRVACRVA